MIAAFHGHADGVKALPAFGANAGVAMKKEKLTPLMLASFNGSRNAVRLLLHSGANAECTDANGHTALDMAVSKGHKDCADCLREAMQK